MINIYLVGSRCCSAGLRHLCKLEPTCVSACLTSSKRKEKLNTHNYSENDLYCVISWLDQAGEDAHEALGGLSNRLEYGYSRDVVKM